MKYFKLILCSLSLLAIVQSVSFAAETGQAATQDSAASVAKRLLGLDQRLKSVSDQQKQIAAKNEEIKNQLKSLRVWIFRRGGGAAPA